MYCGSQACGKWATLLVEHVGNLKVAYRIGYMIYDIWYMIYDICYMLYDIWYIISSYHISYIIYHISATVWAGVQCHATQTRSTPKADKMINRISTVHSDCGKHVHLFAGRASEQWIHLPNVCLVDQAGWVNITYPPPSWLDVSGEKNRILWHEKRVTKQTSVLFFESTSNNSKFAQTWKANTILSIWAIH